MSLLQNSNAIPQLGGYTLTNSLRFRRSASAYLSRTNNKTPTDNTKCSFSIWAKRGDLGSERNYLMVSGTGTSNNTNASFLWINDYFSGGQYSVSPYIDNNILYRDPSAWYHIFISIDTSLGTASDRFKLYINGTLMPNTGTTASGSTWAFLNNSAVCYIGAWAGYYSDYYLADYQAVDGQALAPTDFGEYDAVTGAWKAKEYTGTYGNAGFRLDMSTSGSTVLDVSGNGNNWTANNMNLTTSTATTYDIMSDVPTLTDEDTGNFCTINAVNKDSTVTLEDGNLEYSTSVSGYRPVYGTMGAKSGKWYMEMKLLGSPAAPDLGWFEHDADPSLTGFNQNTRPNLYGVATDGTGNSVLSFNNTSTTTISSGVGWATNDIIGCAIDMDNKKIWFHRNGTWYPASSGGTAGNPSAGTNPTITYTYDDYLVPRSACYSSNYNALINFGQRPFAYTPPTGYKKLNTYNLPDSTIKNGREYFDTAIWNGNNTARTIDNTITDASGTETGKAILFSPDLVWVKGRSNATYHMITDSVRGATKYVYSNDTLAEGTWTDQVTSFNTSGVGFDLGVDTNSTVNYSGRTFVGWIWRGSDSSAVTDSSGTIGTVTRSTNTTSGFSVVTYTGTGTSGQTIPHGLGVTPSLIITKRRDTTGNWVVMPGNSSLLGGSNVLFLNTTSGLTANSNYYSSYPDSSYYYSSTNADINASSGTYVSYVFAEVEGFSKFGTYVGNGSADGPFIYTGFDVKFLIYKSQTAGQYWVLYDSTRDPNGNPQSYYVLPSTSDAEGTSPDALDFLSNGFKIRYANASINTSGQTHIYMAFAESPFKNSLAR